MFALWADAYVRFVVACEQSGVAWWTGPPRECLFCPDEDDPHKQESK